MSDLRTRAALALQSHPLIGYDTPACLELVDAVIWVVLEEARRTVAVIPTTTIGTGTPIASVLTAWEFRDNALQALAKLEQEAQA